jgi:hypothetical protein
MNQIYAQHTSTHIYMPYVYAHVYAFMCTHPEGMCAHESGEMQMVGEDGRISMRRWVISSDFSKVLYGNLIRFI